MRLIGCEAAGRGVDTFETAATLTTGREGIFHGMKSYFCQDKYGQIAPVYSISAGLDYPGIGPEHAYLHDTAAPNTWRSPTTRRWTRLNTCRAWRASSPPSKARTPWRYAMEHRARKWTRTSSSSSTCPAVGDKDCAAIARYRGEDVSE